MHSPSTGRSSSPRTTGVADRARLGGRAPGAGARDRPLQHRHRVPLDGRAAADPARRLAVLRDLGCRRTPRSSAATLATGHGRIRRDVRSAYLAPYRVGADRRAIDDFVADIPTTPAHPSFAPSPRSPNGWPSSTCPYCSPGASAIRSSTSGSPPICAVACRGRAAPLPARRASRRRGRGRRRAGGRLDRAALEPPRRRARAPASSTPEALMGGARRAARMMTRRPLPSAGRLALVRVARAAVAAIADGLREAGVAPATASRCSRPTRRTSSPPPTRAG